YFSIKNSKFISCIAKLGGALRLKKLKDNGINNCYFKECLSLHFQKRDDLKTWNEPWLPKTQYDSSYYTNGGAIYSNNSHYEGVSVLNSKFVASNFYLGRSIIGDYHVRNCEFVDSVFTYEKYSDYYPLKDTTFEKGEYKLDSLYYSYCKPLELDWIENYEGETSFDARSI
ncbi:MAG: hypothetical protein O2897_01260, partial [bacterium]|nr:hypothetical protein [bacterium]